MASTSNLATITLPTLDKLEELMARGSSQAVQRELANHSSTPQELVKTTRLFPFISSIIHAPRKGNERLMELFFKDMGTLKCSMCLIESAECVQLRTSSAACQRCAANKTQCSNVSELRVWLLKKTLKVSKERATLLLSWAKVYIVFPSPVSCQ